MKRRLHRLLRLLPVESQGHQRIAQLLGGRLKGAMGHMGIGPVERVEAAGLGVGHPQHSPE